MVDECMRLNALLDRCESELRDERPDPGHEDAYQRYFTVTRTPKRGIRIAYRDEQIQAATSQCVWFALPANKAMGAGEALDTYANRDTIEKAFADLKDRPDMRRTHTASEESLEGKLFTQYLALQITSYAKKHMIDHGTLTNWTIQGVWDELDVIERHQQPGHQPQWGEITTKQHNLYNTLDLDQPT